MKRTTLPRIGRARCPQAGEAGTKAERGHSCPQQRRTEVTLSNVPILLSIRELLRTRMSALRWRPKNLRALRRFSHMVIQRAASTPRRAGDSAPYLRSPIGPDQAASASRRARSSARVVGHGCEEGPKSSEPDGASKSPVPLFVLLSRSRSPWLS